MNVFDLEVGDTFRFVPDIYQQMEQYVYGGSPSSGGTVMDIEDYSIVREVIFMNFEGEFISRVWTNDLSVDLQRIEILR